ncbi:MAG: GrpB family protein [Ardenticatenaceae bacterium]|nr:GrpB family protein [Ardenticatenaceae bacterium]
MPDPIIIVPYDAQWPDLFRELAAGLRQVLGETALRIDHIGSTAIPGCDAKPIIDVQISVAELEPVDRYQAAIKSLGFFFRHDNPDLTKRYFREIPGRRRTHIHVRRWGSWPEQFALLFRDYLRTHPEEVQKYVQAKYDLARKFRHNRPGYVDGKGPVIWEIMVEASKWTQETGWQPSPSDA